MKPTEGWSRTWTPVPRKDQRKVTSDGQTTAPRLGMACRAASSGASPGQGQERGSAHCCQGDCAAPRVPCARGAPRTSPRGGGSRSQLLKACQDGAGGRKATPSRGAHVQQHNKRSSPAERALALPASPWMLVPTGASVIRCVPQSGEKLSFKLGRHASRNLHFSPSVEENHKRGICSEDSVRLQYPVLAASVKELCCTGKRQGNLVSNC